MVFGLNRNILALGWFMALSLMCSVAEVSAADELSDAPDLAPALAEPADTQPITDTAQLLERAAIPEEDFSKLSAAVQWHYELAKQGDREAQYNLGTLYETGFGVNVDTKKAVFWLTKAADQGHVQAQLKLGLMTILGVGTQASLIKGSKWIRSAANNKNPLASMFMDKILSPESQALVDVKALTDKVYKALAISELNAQETLRIAIHRIEQDREAAPEKERFAGQVTGSGAKPGSVKNQLPNFLDKNALDQSTFGRSVALIRRHAKEGAADAQYEWAHMLETGQDTLVNKPEAVKWYGAAAAQGYADAQYRLGLAYLYGLGVGRDKESATRWLKRASEQQQPAAVLIRSLIGDKQGLDSFDVSFALSVYLERSLQGDGAAMLALGHMCEFGWGVAQDNEKAQRWYAKARAAGVKVAEAKLGDTQAGAVQRDVTVQKLAETARVEPVEAVQGQEISASPARSGTVQRNVIAQPRAAEDKPNQPLPSPASIPSTQLDLLTREGRSLLLQRYGLPVLLVILGVVMGWAVFRLMRRGGAGEVL